MCFLKYKRTRDIPSRVCISSLGHTFSTCWEMISQSILLVEWTLVFAQLGCCIKYGMKKGRREGDREGGMEEERKGGRKEENDYPN